MPEKRAVIDEAVRWQMAQLVKGLRRHGFLAYFGQRNDPHPFYKKRRRRGYKTATSRKTPNSLSDGGLRGVSDA